ncbi:hypothetical protein [Streptomyces sp. NPDC052036]|uniref:hypothetical protein n=1 Tax=unclassified Streptomyces TaxID=2593676 RepID=UPI0034334D93
MMSDAERRQRKRLGGGAGAGRHRARGRGPKRWVSAVDGPGGPLAFAVLVAAAVLLARDPEFRIAVWTFVRGL